MSGGGEERGYARPGMPLLDDNAAANRSHRRSSPRNKVSVEYRMHGNNPDAPEVRRMLPAPAQSPPEVADMPIPTRLAKVLTAKERKKLILAHAKTEGVLDQFFPDAARVLEDTAFNRFIILVIVLNCVTIGAECQWPPEKFGLERLYQVLDLIFLACYIMEVLLKVKAVGIREYIEGPPDDTNNIRRWNMFDLFLTISMLVNVGVSLMAPGSSIMKILRSWSVIRLLRLVKVLKDVEALYVVIGGIVGSMGSIFWVMVALLIFVYAFAIMFVFLVDHAEFLEDGPLAGHTDSYADLTTSMLTLVDVVVLNAWTETIPPTQQWLLCPFFIYVIVSAFGVTNVIIGVIVDATSDMQRRLQHEFRRNALRRMACVWEDELVKNRLTEDDIDNLTGDEQARKKNQRLELIETILTGILESGIVAFPAGISTKELLMVLDHNGNGSVNHEEFTLGMGRLLLNDSFQTNLMSLVNQGIARRNMGQIGDSVKVIGDSVKALHQRMDDMIMPKSRHENVFLNPAFEFMS